MATAYSVTLSTLSLSCAVKSRRLENVSSLEKLRKLQLYELLLNTTLEFCDDCRVDGKPFLYIYRRKSIEYVRARDTHSYPLHRLDENVDLKTLIFNNQQRSWFVDLPVERHRKYYRALKALNDCLYREDNALNIRFKNGKVGSMISSIGQCR